MFNLWILMCLQSLMKFHHCMFKILRKKQNLADGSKDRQTTQFGITRQSLVMPNRDPLYPCKFIPLQSLFAEGILFSWLERRKFLSIVKNNDRNFFLHTIYLFTHLFHVIKCIQCIVGFVRTHPRQTGMHSFNVRTAAADAKWATAQKIDCQFWRIWPTCAGRIHMSRATRKRVFRSFRPGQTQTSLRSHRS